MGRENSAQLQYFSGKLEFARKMERKRSSLRRLSSTCTEREKHLKQLRNFVLSIFNLIKLMFTKVIASRSQQVECCESVR